MNASVSFSEITLDGRDDKAAVFSFQGQLDEVSSDSVFQKVEEYLAQNTEIQGFLFDFKELEYLNSKSLGFLIDFYRKIGERSGKMVITNSSDNVFDILDLVGVTRVIDTTKTIEEAKLALLDAFHHEE